MPGQDDLYSPAEIRHRIGADGTFTLSSVSGDVRLRGVDGDEVVVLATSAGGDDRPLPLIVRRPDGALHIETEENRGWFSRGHGSVDFDVSVPRGARVEISGVSADVHATGLSGNQSYKAVSGDLKIMDTGGRVSATTVSGDVELIGAYPLEASVNTTSGDADLSAPVFQPVRIRTVSGDLTIRGGFASGPQHTVESVSGDLTLESSTGLTIDAKRGLDFSKRGNEPIVTGDGSARLRFRSLSGDVQLSGSGSSDTESKPPEPPPQPPSAEASLEILHALERGEIDIDEATRRLEGVEQHG